MAEPTNNSQYLTVTLSEVSGVKVVVSNLAESVIPRQISYHFEGIGNIRNVRMLSKGVAEIVFACWESAEKAIEIYDMTPFWDGKLMKLRIDGVHFPS